MKNIQYCFFLLIICMGICGSTVFAQQGTAEPKFKIGGYVQGVWQYGEKDSKPSVGKYANGEENISRVGIRRGRLKFAYSETFGKVVFQIDATENGVKVKDAYLELMHPSFEWIRFRGGIFDRPFGYEIRYSSYLRETLERSTVVQTLFPQERDLGGMIVVRAPESHALHFLKLEGGLFAGNGINPDTDNKKDFIGRFSAEKTFGNLTLSGGVSTYLGKIKSVNDTTFRYVSTGFEPDNAYIAGDYLSRQYFGMDIQIAHRHLLGVTTFRGEYLFGKQPGVSNSSKSPNAGELPDISTQYYLREFSGAYAYLVHSFGQKKRPMHSLVLKYDFYNPNTKVSGNETGFNPNTSSADLATNAFTMGYLFSPCEQIRIMATYEIRKNETTPHIGKYKSDRKDNLFTLGVLYKF